MKIHHIRILKYIYSEIILEDRFMEDVFTYIKTTMHWYMAATAAPEVEKCSNDPPISWMWGVFKKIKKRIKVWVLDLVQSDVLDVKTTLFVCPEMLIFL